MSAQIRRPRTPRRLVDMIRAMPSCIEVERAFIGSLIYAPNRLPEAAQDVQPSDLYLATHQRLYALLLELHGARKAVNAVTVPMLCARTTIYGTPGEVLAIIDEHSPDALPSYAREIRSAAMAREVIAAVSSATDEAHGYADPEALIDATIRKLGAIRRATAGDEPEHIDDILIGRMDDIANEAESGVTTCVSTGIDALDVALGGGFETGDLVILAARPGAGKSCLGFNIANNIAKSGKAAALFLLEMSTKQVANRVLAEASNIPMQYLKRPTNMTSDHFNRMEQGYQKPRGDMLIKRQARMSVEVIRSKCLQWQMQYGEIGIIMVDYLQLMPTDMRHLPASIAENCDGLLALGKEIGAPVLLLCQLNRELEKRDDKRPRPSDIKGSGSVEQNADTMLMLYREIMYDDEADERDVEVIIVKQRQGKLGTVPLVFNGECQRFSSPSSRGPLGDI